MPRCPNGSRRNKKTGECVSTAKKSSPVKSPSPVTKKRRCPNGTRRNKSTGECVGKNGKTSRLEHTLISKHYFDKFMPNLSPEKQKYLVDNMHKLQRMQYDPKYISCFTGKKTKNQFAMIDDKIYCWNKYGIETF
jgi:hypothetical protein